MALGRALGALLAAVAALGSAPPELRFVSDHGQTVIEVGLSPERLADLKSEPPPDWSTLFTVQTLEASLAEEALPPLLGSYSIGATAVRFTPRFPLAAGVAYLARWHDGNLHIELRHEAPKPELPPSTTLRAVYPSVAEVPQNLLRIYLQFSAPMSEGRAKDHVRLVDASGRTVEGAFVAPERELWSPDGTRLTLFFDPGRIKRGVGPHNEVGPPLRPGESYRVEIDHELGDARGVPLVRDYFKRYTAVSPDRDQPNTEAWHLEPPTRRDEAVRLTFPESLDHGLLHGLLFVIDASGNAIDGKTSVDLGETSWVFRPVEDWAAGTYSVRVPTLLEDLAGNSLRRPFEVALDGEDHPGDEPTFIDLPFAVR